MSKQEKLNPKDLQMSKTDRKTLLKFLEKYYVTHLFNWQHQLEHPSETATPTQNVKQDRRFRTLVKCIEIILHRLGSDFMENVKPPSIRTTSKINARDSGLLQSKKSLVDSANKQRAKR
jgi:hypothetical protein